ncbi:hypothetical protein [Thermosphaera sp.]
MEKAEVLIAVALALILTFSTTVIASWDYTRNFSDPSGDNDGCLGFTDILTIRYGFNGTHVGFNITVKEGIPLPSTTTYYYGVLIDSDNNPSTGLQHWTGIGVDYLFEAYIDTSTVSNPAVKLFKYAGNGTSWDWNPVSRAEVSASVYTETVSNDTIELVVGKNYLTPLAGEVSFTVYVSGEQATCDIRAVFPGAEGPVPIPESATLVVASVLIVSAISLFIIRDKL